MIFYKYHGAGNDFVLIDGFSDDFPKIIEEKEIGHLTRRLCKRHFGIGADGLILVKKSRIADVRMRIFNPDGNEAEMCGNGIRCLAKHVYDRDIIKKTRMTVETAAGIKKVETTVRGGKVTYARVDMGRPLFAGKDIPARVSGHVMNHLIDVGEDGEVEISAVNTGVPHAVIFVDDVENIDVIKIGRSIRYNELFPMGTNVNFVERIDRNVFKIRTYERGVEDETLACGTGICAAGAVLSASEKGEKACLKDPLEFRAKGGVVFVELRDGRIYMNGPAEFVFEGVV